MRRFLEAPEQGANLVGFIQALIAISEATEDSLAMRAAHQLSEQLPPWHPTAIAVREHRAEREAAIEDTLSAYRTTIPWDRATILLTMAEVLPPPERHRPRARGLTDHQPHDGRRCSVPRTRSRIATSTGTSTAGVPAVCFRPPRRNHLMALAVLAPRMPEEARRRVESQVVDHARQMAYLASPDHSSRGPAASSRRAPSADLGGNGARREAARVRTCCSRRHHP